MAKNVVLNNLDTFINLSFFLCDALKSYTVSIHSISYLSLEWSLSAGNCEVTENLGQGVAIIYVSTHYYSIYCAIKGYSYILPTLSDGMDEGNCAFIS